MNKKKGFTLAELLTCILILGMIALIGVPAVTKVIKKSRERSYRVTINNVMAAIKDNCKQEQLTEDYITNKYYFTQDEVYPKLDVKGKLPTNGTVEVDDNCKIKKMNLTNGKYLAQYNNDNIEIIQGNATYKVGDLVYFDPATKNPCNGLTFNENDVKTNTSTCYKWRVISTSDDSKKKNITIMLDHNLSMSYWSSSSDNAPINIGPKYLMERLNELTSEWNNTPELNYKYSDIIYGKLICNDGSCSIDNNALTGKSKARIISMEEIAQITNTVATGDVTSKSWSQDNNADFYFSSSNHKIGSLTSETGNTDLSWLVENTSLYDRNSKNTTSGSTANVYGYGHESYCTLTTKYYSSYYVYTIFAIGKAANSYSGDSRYSQLTNAYCGIRPVIDISKNNIS